MPTTKGWAAIGVSLALFALWAGFGEAELLATAVFLMTAMLIATAFVASLSPSVHLTRRIVPDRVHEGDEVVVEISLATDRSVRNLSLEDTVHGLGMARFAAARTRRGVPLVARYEIACRARGVYDIGPAQASIMDPLALAERRTAAGRPDRIIVYPRVEVLAGLPAVRGHDPAMRSSRPALATQGGEDFFTLRAYQTGDDLRKIHWPSSAKRDDLMIRQLEIPWQSRALILLDQRRIPYATQEAFEHAVRGAACVISHFYRSGFGPELWTAQRAPVSNSSNRYRQSMDVLASVQPITGTRLPATVARLRRHGAGGGALILITGTPDHEVVGAYRSLAGSFARSVVMAVTASPSSELGVLGRAGAVTVAVSAATRWAPAWREAMEMSWATASVP